jgi:hypothetical protein
MSTKLPGDRGRGRHLGRDEVGAPAAPWRPSKLRFEVDAQRSPGARMSGFIPRHIEQPALAPVEAGSRKI